MRRARRAFTEQMHRLFLALQHESGGAKLTCPLVERLKGVKVQVCLQELDGSAGLARIYQGSGVSIVDEIGVEREGSLEFWRL